MPTEGVSQLANLSGSMTDGLVIVLCHGDFMKKIAVIGAGVTGVTTAYKLLNNGYNVTVFEKERYPGMDTSFANGGQLSASNAEVWTSKKTVIQGIKWMLKKDAPLLLNPKPSVHKLGWVIEFLSNIRHHKKNTIATAEMAIQSRKELNKIIDKENLKIDLVKKGILHLCNSKEGFQHGLKVNNWLNEAGLDRYPITLKEINKIEPTINLDNIYAGFYTKSDMTGDIHLFTKQLAYVCKNKGVAFNFESYVTDIKHLNGKIKIFYKQNSEIKEESFSGLVVCAGVNSKQLANIVGDKINIYPVKGYSITVILNDKKSQDSAPTVSLLDDGAKIVTSRLGKNRFRIAGTAEFNGYNRDIRNDRIFPLIKWCNNLFPNVSTEHCIPWAGLRPMTPSMMPKVGKGKLPGIFYNTGHGHLGWTLGAITSQIISDEILRNNNLLN